VIPASKFEKSTQKADRELDQNAHFFAACEWVRRFSVVSYPLWVRR
jgi:hypothetical protein